MSEIKNIHQALAAITAAVSPVGKDNTNPQQGFKFRGIDDILNSLHQLFADHGVFIRVGEIKTISREEKTTKSGSILIYSINDYQFIFASADGTELTAWGRGEASDTADKSSNKAISAALKYALMQMFLIPTQEEKDADAYHNEPVVGRKPVNPYRAKDELTEEHAIQMIRTAQTLPELAQAWKAIGRKMQETPIIMQEKETKKSELSQPNES